MTTSLDVLEQLIGPEWRGIPFPLLGMRTSGSTDMVEHKRPDQDGFHVEATGANNLVITATIPFRNSLRAAPSEKWAGQTLFPDIFRRFVAACANAMTGELVHPDLGKLNVKCRTFNWNYDPNKRDGCDFDVEWVQSLDDGEFIGSISVYSPVATGIAVASKLDEQIVIMFPAPPELLEDPVSFSDMMRSLQAIPDTATLLSKQVGGIFHRIVAKLDRLEDALARFNATRWWPIVDGMEHLRATVFDLQRKFAVDHKAIREYLVRVPSTLAVLAQLLDQKLDDMIRLNRDKLEKPVIPAGARVKYYKVAA